MGKRGKRKAELPARVGQVRRQIERWRRTRKKRTRMSEELWSAAVELAQEHGVWRIAHELTIRYESLKERVVAAGDRPKRQRRRRRPRPPELVEVLPGWVDAGAPGCTVELRDRSGSAMTIRLADANGVDVAELSETFWKRRRRR